jgi:hypothetical protein
METDVETTPKNDEALPDATPDKNSKRFNLKLSEEAYADIDQLSRLGGGRSMSDVVRLAISLLKVVYPAMINGHELYLVNPIKDTERQLILPR